MLVSHLETSTTLLLATFYNNQQISRQVFRQGRQGEGRGPASRDVLAQNYLAGGGKSVKMPGACEPPRDLNHCAPCNSMTFFIINTDLLTVEISLK